MTSAESGTAGQWGAWFFDAGTLALKLRGQGLPTYSIPLPGITSSACMLDVIFDIREQSWADNAVLGDLISAFQDLFDPRVTLCGSCRDKLFDPIKHLKSNTVH